MRGVPTAGLLIFTLACAGDSAIAPMLRNPDAHAYTSPDLIYKIVVDSVIDLDPGGPQSEAADINENGWIVGTRGVGGIDGRSTLWKGSASQRFQLPQPNGASFSDALGINDNGAIVGMYSTYGSTDSWMWTPTTGLSLIPNSLFTFPNGDPVLHVLVRDINNLGTIVGTLRGHNSRAAAFRKGTLGTEVLSTCGAGNSWGYTINDSDWIAGKSNGSSEEAFVKVGSSCNRHYLKSDLWRLNNNGVAVGSAFISGSGDQALRWSQSMGYTLLEANGTRRTVAYGINNNGIIVGGVGSSTNEEPFVYHNKTGIVLLPDRRASSCWRTKDRRGVAMAINDSKWIVGYSEDCFGKRHATLWKIRLVTTDPTSSTP